jgi:hypothetical protein
MTKKEFVFLSVGTNKTVLNLMLQQQKINAVPLKNMPLEISITTVLWSVNY